MPMSGWPPPRQRQGDVAGMVDRGQLRDSGDPVGPGERIGAEQGQHADDRRRHERAHPLARHDEEDDAGDRERDRSALALRHQPAHDHRGRGTQ
jgi:hypothetical protein